MSVWPPGTSGLLRLPSGRIIRGVSLRSSEPSTSRRETPLPEFGLYLSGRTGSVTPWPARWLVWPDFGLPGDGAEATAALAEVWHRAEVERVEVGCRGGRGRTGTALACLAVLDGIPAGSAVSFVRARYHHRAVETPQQRRFVRRFGPQLH